MNNKENIPKPGDIFMDPDANTAYILSVFWGWGDQKYYGAVNLITGFMWCEPEPILTDAIKGLQLLEFNFWNSTF